MVTEEEKHWNKIKFYAQKWREAEIRGGEIKSQIINLQVELDKVDKEVKLYMRKTRSNILLEVI